MRSRGWRLIAIVPSPLADEIGIGSLSDTQATEGGVSRDGRVEGADRRAISGELLSAVMSLLPDAGVVVDAAGVIVSVNQHAEELFGYPPGSLSGVPVESLVPDRLRHRHRQHRAGFLEAPEYGPIGAGLKMSGRRADGTEFPIDVSLAPILNSGERQVVAAIRDVTRHRAAERDLQRLLEEEASLQQRHAATAEIRLALLSDSPLEEALTLICRRATELVNAPVSAICAKEPAGIRVVAGMGPASHMVGALLPPGRSLAERVIDRGEPIEVRRRSDVSDAQVPEDLPDGPALGVPILSGGVSRAALTFARADHSDGFSSGVRVFAEALAAQAALAFELERARRQREDLMLVGDRERIARDLHDHVIQRLFATGIGLHGSLPLIDSPRARERVSDAIDTLDETIREIRDTIFALSAHGYDGRLLTSQISRVVREARTSLGFEPFARFEGLVDSGVPDEVVPHVLACVRESLSNVARHSHASEVTVRLALADDALVLTVTDDGVGMGSRVRSSGLVNLEERARLLGGSLEITEPAGGGTRLDWKVPVQS